MTDSCSIMPLISAERHRGKKPTRSSGLCGNKLEEEVKKNKKNMQTRWAPLSTLNRQGWAFPSISHGEEEHAWKGSGDGGHGGGLRRRRGSWKSCLCSRTHKWRDGAESASSPADWGWMGVWPAAVRNKRTHTHKHTRAHTLGRWIYFIKKIKYLYFVKYFPWQNRQYTFFSTVILLYYSAMKKLFTYSSLLHCNRLLDNTTVVIPKQDTQTSPYYCHYYMLTIQPFKIYKHYYRGVTEHVSCCRSFISFFFFLLLQYKCMNFLKFSRDWFKRLALLILKNNSAL